MHKRKGKHSVPVSSDSESEDTPIKRKKEDRNKKVQNQVEELKERHGQSTYTSMQYQIWTELLIGGVYSDTSEPPTHSIMFIRAGTGGAQKRNSSRASVTTTPTSSLGSSPAKLIENRSKCYKQLVDLHSLKQSGLLSETEYTSEREAVMSMLKMLTES